LDHFRFVFGEIDTFVLCLLYMVSHTRIRPGETSTDLAYCKAASVPKKLGCCTHDQLMNVPLEVSTRNDQVAVVLVVESPAVKVIDLCNAYICRTKTHWMICDGQAIFTFSAVVA
jgi:hypothetical protein